MSRFNIILMWLFRERDRSSFLSDLEEIHSALRDEKGWLSADLWYLGQIFKSLGPALKNKIYRSMNMFQNYLKITLRNIRKHKGYSFINIAGLAVGMACCLLTLQWVRYEISYDRFHENAERLHLVQFYAPEFDAYGRGMPGPAADFLREEYPEILLSTVFGRTGAKFSYNRRNFNCSGAYIHDDFLKMFSFPMIAGDTENPFPQRNSVLITEDLGRRLYGEEDPLGKMILINDRSQFQVSGVISDILPNSELDFDFLLSFEIAPNGMKMWDNKWPDVYVLLEDNVTHEEVTGKIVDVYNDHNPGATFNNLLLRPLTEIHLYDPAGGGLINYIFVYSTMAVVILLIACFNYMNLSTARSVGRMNEIGIKKVVGSTRFQLIKQFLSESLLLTFIALIIAVILANLFMPAVNNILGRRIAAGISAEFIIASIGIAILTGFVSGSYPALFLSSFSPHNILKGMVFGSRKGNTGTFAIRKILVTIQYSLSIAFIIAAIVIFKQLDFMKNTDLGFKKDNVLIMRTSGILSVRVPVLKQELMKNPDIINTSVSAFSIVQWGSSMGITWPGKSDSHTPFDVIYNWVDYNYLDTFGLELVSGRFLSDEYPSDATDAFVINEACVRAMGIEDPIGMRIVQGPGSQFENARVVVGVVRDYHNLSLHNEIKPFIFKYSGRNNYLNIKIQSENIGETISFIREKTAEVAPNSQFDYWFLDDEINNLYIAEQTTGRFMIYLTILAIFISSLGLLGLTSYTVQQRVKEIGIRKVFGAPVSSIVTLFTKDFTKWIIISNIIAWPLAYFALNRWLQNFAYRTDIGLIVLFASGIIAFLLALITIVSQTVKAAATNPADSLRYE
ncbi:ABC transporter permease [candidate division KSB1 bacterium]